MSEKAEIYCITNKYELPLVFFEYRSNNDKVGGFYFVKNPLDGDMAKSVQDFGLINGTKLKTALPQPPESKDVA